MDALTLVNMALTALMVATLPAAMVWMSSDANKYRKLAWTCVFLIFDLIVFGGYTRLTDSGLGCPDWPGCYGTANPFLAHDAIQHAQALMPSGPVTLSKAWIEMIHRYLAMAIGVLIIAPVAQGAPRRLRAVAADRAAGLLLFAGRVRRADGDAETAAHHRHLPPAAGHGIAVADDVVRQPAGYAARALARVERLAAGDAQHPPAGRGLGRAAAGAAGAGRLGQHQLRGAGLRRLPAVRRQAGAGDGYAAGLYLVARLGPQRRRQLSDLPGADRDPLGAPQFRLHRRAGDGLHGVARVGTRGLA